MRSSVSKALGRVIAFCALGFAGAAMMSSVHAQQYDPASGNFSGFSGAPVLGGAQAANPAFGKPKPPPPAALPGAQSRASTPAPSATPPVLMDPTQALFDAINRGDAGAARDAISRGADVNAQNELGMTPVQLSLDLGHNDITFLLLSNGAGKPSGGPASAQAAPVQKAVAPPARVKPAEVARQKPAAVQRPVTQAGQTPQLPRLYAGDGGTPIPSAGFLGFDPGR